jgi:hypothetical protein
MSSVSDQRSSRADLGLQFWFINSPEKVDEAVEALSSAIATVEGGTTFKGDAIVNSGLRAELKQHLVQLSAHNLMLFLRTSADQVHVAAYTMPAEASASYLGTRSMSVEAGAGKAVDMALSLTQERTLKHQIAARTKQVHAEEVTESLNSSEFVSAINFCTALKAGVPAAVLGRSPEAWIAHQSAVANRYKAAFKQAFDVTQ